MTIDGARLDFSTTLDFGSIKYKNRSDTEIVKQPVIP